MVNIANLRTDYKRETLDESQVDPNPLRQFARWFDEALTAQLPEANAMALATADSQGRPAARIVLLKSVDTRGFVFFTNYESRKARELSRQPHAALLFHWVALERQVRIEGAVETVDAADSDEYFASRPYLSQIGAWASPQSEAMADRAALEARFAEFEARYATRGGVPRPPHWGGYRLVPEALEFWQGRASRLHDRIRYRRIDTDDWCIERLAP